MVAEPRDLDADQFGGPYHQGALGHTDLHAVDGEVHHLDSCGVGAGVCGLRHLTPHPLIRVTSRADAKLHFSAACRVILRLLAEVITPPPLPWPSASRRAGRTDSRRTDAPCTRRGRT